MKRIYVIGYMASGKSTIGPLMADALSFEFIDMDKAIEERMGLSIAQIFHRYGEGEFRKIESSILFTLSQKEQVVISTGGGAPCYYDNMSYMQSLGTVIYLKVNAEELALRLEGDTTGTRPLIKDHKGQELSNQVRLRLQERQQIYEQADVIIDGTRASSQIVQDIIEAFT